MYRRHCWLRARTALSSTCTTAAQVNAAPPPAQDSIRNATAELHPHAVQQLQAQAGTPQNTMTKPKPSTYKLQTARCNTNHCMHFTFQKLKRCLHNHLATWQPALQAVQQPAPANTPHRGSNETHRTTCSSNEPVMQGIAPTQCHCWASTLFALPTLAHKKLTVCRPAKHA